MARRQHNYIVSFADFDYQQIGVRFYALLVQLLGVGGATQQPGLVTEDFLRAASNLYLFLLSFLPAVSFSLGLKI